MRNKLPVFNTQFPKAEFSIEKSIYAKWNPQLKASDDDEKTVTIYQAIGEDFMGEGFTARRMSAALRSIGKDKDVTVSINSPGGDFFEGAAIYNLLREHEGKVTVKVIGLAASAASLIAMAADKIVMSQASFMMVHNAWGIVMGNRNDMRQAADVFEVFDSTMSETYAVRTGQDKDEVGKMMDKDTWLNAETALEKGFADEIAPAKSVEKDDDDKKTKAMARRKIEMAMAKEGLTRKDREEILKSAFGARDAAEPVRDAGLEAIQELINVMK